METKDKFYLAGLLQRKGFYLSSAESLTGGMFSSEICSVPGASNFFKGGMVTYLNEVKELLGVKKETLEKYGAVSKNCAEEMSYSAAKFFKSDIAISFTGNAGPSVMENKKVGEVYIGITYLNQTFTYACSFEGDRNQIRKASVDTGIELLSDLLEEIL